MGRKVEVHPKSWLVSFLVKQRRGEIARKLMARLTSAVASSVTFFFTSHGGQEFAGEIGVGAAALVYFGIEWLWTKFELRFSSVKIVEGMLSPKPVTQGDAKDLLADIAAKESVKVTLPIQCLILALMLASCRTAKPEPYTPPTYGDPKNQAPTTGWQAAAADGVRKAFAQHYSYPRARSK